MGALRLILAAVVGIGSPVYSDTLRIIGFNASDREQVVVVRVDDYASPPYSDRFNGEHWVGPGPFEVDQPLDNLVTPSGRLLDQPYMLVKPFAVNSAVDIGQVTRVPDADWGAVLAWDFGGQRVEPGFTAPQISADQVIRRDQQQTNPDPLTSDGLRLNEWLLSVPVGTYFVAIWADDPGQWEWVPTFRNRTLTIDGVELVSQQYTEDQWRERYALSSISYPKLIEQLSRPTAVTRMELGPESVLRIHSDDPSGQFVAGLLVAESPETLHRYLQYRERQTLKRWPLAAQGRKIRFEPIQPAMLTAVDEWRFFEVPSFSRLVREGLDDWFEVYLLERQAGLARQSLSGNLLTQDFNQLSISDEIGPHGGVLAVRARKVGQYPLVMITEDQRQTILFNAFEVDRPPAKPVGLFWEAPFWMSQSERFRQFQCDQQQLEPYGIGLFAPSLPLPLDPLDLQDWVPFAGGASHMVSYAELRRLPADHHTAAQWLQAMAQLGVVVSVADEPSNAGEAISNRVSDLRINFPELQLAGFLNHPNDLGLALGLDRVYLNPAFNLADVRLQALSEAGKDVWLYNVDDPRWGAGMGLNSEFLTGTLFWHARLPTAWPNNPTDGRETDISWLGNPSYLCQPMQPNAKLFQAVEGREDLRWGQWAKRENLPVTNYRDRQGLDRWRAFLRKNAAEASSAHRR